MSIRDRFKRMADITSAVHNTYAFIDVEVGTRDHKIHDIGASRYDGASYHNPSKQDFMECYCEKSDSSVAQSVKTRRTGNGRFAS